MKRIGLACVALALTALLAIEVDSQDDRTVYEGDITGRVELVPGVPMKNCRVYVEAKTVAAECNEEGVFYLRGVSEGRSFLRIYRIGADGRSIDRGFQRRFARRGVTVFKDTLSDVGTIVASKFGAVHGRVVGADAEHLSAMVVAIPEFGIATKPDEHGYYVLSRVPPGTWPISLHGVWYDRKYPVRLQTVTVKPGELTKKPNFVLKPPFDKQMKRPTDPARGPLEPRPLEPR